jgi:dCMP deaminase
MTDFGFDLRAFGNQMLHLRERLDWDTYHMATAVLMGSRSNCNRLHVGCVIVKDKHFISAGYNGFLPGAPHTSMMVDGHEQATVHAEQNAVANAASRPCAIEGATAYVTHRPCINCAKVLAAAKVKEIVYLNEYGSDTYTVPFLEAAGVNVRKLENQ